MSDQEYYDLLDTTQIPLKKVLKTKYDFKITEIFYIARICMRHFKLPIFFGVIFSLLAFGLGIWIYVFYKLFFEQFISTLVESELIQKLFVSFLLSVFYSIFWAGFSSLTLKHLKGEEISFLKDFFTPLTSFTKLFGFFFLQEIVAILIEIPTEIIAIYVFSDLSLVFISFILVICLQISWSLTMWIIIDYPDNNVFQCILTSMKIVNQHFFKFSLFYGILTLMTLSAAIPLGIGLIWIWPFTWLMSGILYKSIFYTTEE